MSDTPRTDLAYKHAWSGPFSGEPETQAWEFARKLERELNEARAQLDRLARPFFAEERATVQDENTRLQAASAVLREQNNRILTALADKTMWGEKLEVENAALRAELQVYQLVYKTCTCQPDDAIVAARAAIKAAKGGTK